MSQHANFQRVHTIGYIQRSVNIRLLRRLKAYMLVGSAAGGYGYVYRRRRSVVTKSTGRHVIFKLTHTIPPYSNIQGAGRLVFNRNFVGQAGTPNSHIPKN